MHDTEKLSYPEDSLIFASYAEVAKMFWIYRVAAMFFLVFIGIEIIVLHVS